MISGLWLGSLKVRLNAFFGIFFASSSANPSSALFFSGCTWMESMSFTSRILKKNGIHPAIFLSQSQKKPDPEIFGRIFEEKHPPLSQMDKPDAFPATAQQRDHYPYYPGTTNREYILFPPIHKVGYNL